MDRASGNPGRSFTLALGSTTNQKEKDSSGLRSPSTRETLKMGINMERVLSCSIMGIDMMARIPMENHKAMELTIGAMDQCTKESSRTD